MGGLRFQFDSSLRKLERALQRVEIDVIRVKAIACYVTIEESQARDPAKIIAAVKRGHQTLAAS